jgi:GTP-binding protein YchF
MSINIGIVGLPNVGKSTLFNAMSAAGAESANFPFCTIEPNVGVVPVPDDRLAQLAKIYGSKRIVPTSLEFVDIAGLVRGASKGEGLGNQFLGHIRQVDAIVQVVRCFESEDVVHVDGSVDPRRDVEVIETELMLKDLETVEARMQKAGKFTKSAGKQGEQARDEVQVLEALAKHLGEGKVAHTFPTTDATRPLVKELCLLTDKPVVFVGNVAEEDAATPENSPHFKALMDLAKERYAEVLAISAAIEAEVSQLEPAERTDYLESLGLTEPGLHQVVRAGYRALGLITYLTAGPEESRAWTIRTNTSAPAAAGVIHSDFERGFIKAEVIKCDDLVALKSEQAVRQAGKLRVEGKEYIVQDGDVMHFRFNV